MDTLVFLGRTLELLGGGGGEPLRHRRVDWPGLAVRMGGAAAQYAIFDSNWVIGSALLLDAVEFVADKIPWVDTLWDTVHTFIRPLGGAAVAVASLGDASPGMTGPRRPGRHRRRRCARDEGRHEGCGEHEPRAVLELARQPR